MQCLLTFVMLFYIDPGRFPCVTLTLNESFPLGIRNLTKWKTSPLLLRPPALMTNDIKNLVLRAPVRVVTTLLHWKVCFSICISATTYWGCLKRLVISSNFCKNVHFFNIVQLTNVVVGPHWSRSKLIMTLCFFLMQRISGSWSYRWDRGRNCWTISRTDPRTFLLPLPIPLSLPPPLPQMTFFLDAEHAHSLRKPPTWKWIYTWGKSWRAKKLEAGSLVVSY